LNSKLAIIVSIIMLSAVFIVITPAVAAPKDLPEQAKLHVPEFKVQIIEYEGLRAVVKPVYTTLDDPANHVTTSGVFDGVGKLSIEWPAGFVGCSGTLLDTGKHVLSAAHCFTDDIGNPIWISGWVNFGAISENFASVTIHPDWNGDVFVGNDIAVVELENEITSITGYDLDRNSKDDKGTIGDKVGYGVSGFLATGEDPLYPFGTKRDVQNKYDDHADTMLKALGYKQGKDFVRQSVLQYDGDDGTSPHDAFGFFFNNFNLGLTGNNQEGNSASGDSGGPTFTKINNEYFVTGVTSYGVVLTFVGGATSDCNLNLVLIDGQLVNIPDSSCGEFSGDTSVSKYASFVDSVTGGGGNGGTVEEPNCPPKSKSPKCA